MNSEVHRVQIALHRLRQNMESGHANLVESGVTKPQMFMLYAIDKRKACKLTHLAEMMEVKPSAITVMIDRLEKPGYVKRTHDTIDRRSVLVEVTPSGKEVLKKTIRERNKILERYLTRLTPEEVTLFTELLERVASPE